MKNKDEEIKFLRSIHSELIVEEFPPSFAKLYSQFTRFKLNQPSLNGWRDEEFSERLSEAIKLLDLGLSIKQLNGDGWREALKQSGELLEWLSHPNLNIDNLPLRLLSAGIYQIAGYPALSTGLLKNDETSSRDSKILTSLLKGDFPKLFSYIVEYWEANKNDDINYRRTFNQMNPDILSNILIDEMVKSLGIICSFMRWEEDDRLLIAQKKLKKLSEVMIYGENDYSWLLSKVVSEVVDEYISSSMRGYALKLKETSSADGKRAFEQYLRSNYQSSKSLTWYSQITGIEKLLEDKSFALCTPTGSGKTTIAELAIIQNIFDKVAEKGLMTKRNRIVMYLVPSRALANEVELKLEKSLKRMNINITGLYGGIDWGPTDAWITSNESSVLICTYEKAEALIRFLGPLFINRVSLVVVDEAHSVQFSNSNFEKLRIAEDRSLRLEMLVSKLLSYSVPKKIIALSAVANDNESISNWISQNHDSNAIVSNYHSTRQLVGRLEWDKNGSYKIHYDLLNKNRLKFDDEGKEESPFIYNPFSKFPIEYDSLPKKFISKNNGVNKRQRPFLFWSAMQLAQPDEKGVRHSVLISITQHMNGYAEDFLHVLEKILVNENLPSFFEVPKDDEHLLLFKRCLDVCEDYFGNESYEYRLLNRGIVIHHGSMPGLLARLLIELIQKQIVYIALATSTLSEGVNLPFETIIIPTLKRQGELMPASEFKNLIGRAGRPGSGTEGKTLVFLETETTNRIDNISRKEYFQLVDSLNEIQIPQDDDDAISPLGSLMKHIVFEWMELTGLKSMKKFTEWLEQTIPLQNTNDLMNNTAEEALDSLDSSLLSFIVEKELVASEKLDKSQIEEFLIEVWKSTYANTVMKNREEWEIIFSTRGKALYTDIYPNPDTRRRIYKTSVPPRFAKEILKNYLSIQTILKDGFSYSEWTNERKQQFILDIVNFISEFKKFNIPSTEGRGKTPPTKGDILRWWLNPQEVEITPDQKQVSRWIKFIKNNFEYKFNWGLGTVLGLILDDLNDGELKETKIEEWPKTELPWIVFWLKDLINWGTLDPVVAFLLSEGKALTRSKAIEIAKEYYVVNEETSISEKLNPLKIKSWANKFTIKSSDQFRKSNLNNIDVELLREFNNSKKSKWRVIPIRYDKSISWIDSAGYVMAKSEIPLFWKDDIHSDYDFILDSKTKLIDVSNFL